MFTRNNIEFDDACQLINDLVFNYIYKYGEHVYLKRHALFVNKSGFSAAIMLVCQQILVVEEMINTDAHSENAYFPHLRRFISDKLEPLSQNPFTYNEFESIWRTLSKEIYSINQDDKCVTFSFDEVQGVNKAKRFPLSQALFTKEDVVRIIDAIGQSNLKTNNEQKIFSLIRSNRSILSRRGKRLITHLWTKHALIRQVKGLSTSIGELNQVREVIRNSKKNISALHIKVYLDPSDWLNAEYVINLFDGNDELVNDIEIVNKYFNAIITENIYIVLVPNSDGNCWILESGTYVPKVGDELIVIFVKKSSVSKLVTLYFGVSEDEISNRKFSRSTTCSYFKCYVNNNLDDSFCIQNGKIFKSNEGDYSRVVEYKGGITVNSAKDRFSCLYLPDCVIISGKVYQLSGDVKINESLHTFENFRETIRLLTNNEDYNIELEDGALIKLKVAPRYKEPFSAIDYTHYKGRFMPVSKYFKDLALRPLVLNMPSYDIYMKLKHDIGNSDFASISSSLKVLQSKPQT